jgi:hypothetical protein
MMNSRIHTQNKIYIKISLIIESIAVSHLPPIPVYFSRISKSIRKIALSLLFFLHMSANCIARFSTECVHEVDGALRTRQNYPDKYQSAAN